MKMYSRSQVIFISLLSVFAAVILLESAGFLNLWGNKNLQRGEDFAVPSFEGIISPAQNSPQFCDDELVNIRIYEELNEAVVNISTEIVTYNWFLEPVPREGGSGSGTIIDPRGYILTNRHVVQNAFKVRITLADGSQYDGKVIGTDAENDLAVVKFNPGKLKLKTIPLGSSSDLKVGQKVLAVGNPFGYDRTLTTGIVSGLGRPVRTSNDLIIKDMIQTDASINPGNSGGPLINSQGDMIGINTMIFTPSGGSVGIGFAVSVDTARRVVPDLMKYGVVKRGWIDIVPVQIFPQLVRYASLPVTKGILVSKVIANGNADQVGIRGGKRAVRYGSSTIFIGGDIILEVDNTPVEGLVDLYSALEDNKPGDEVAVVVTRGNKKRVFSVTLSERPARYQLE